MRSVERRLTALEALSRPAATSSPAEMREAMACADIDAPQPLPAECLTDWLKRVPSESLEALMQLKDARHE